MSTAYIHVLKRIDVADYASIISVLAKLTGMAPLHAFFQTFVLDAWFMFRKVLKEKPFPEQNEEAAAIQRATNWAALAQCLTDSAGSSQLAHLEELVTEAMKLVPTITKVSARAEFLIDAFDVNAAIQLMKDAQNLIVMGRKYDREASDKMMTQVSEMLNEDSDIMKAVAKIKAQDAVWTAEDAAG